MKRFRSGSVFNLASVGKVFDATLLVRAVRQGEVSSDAGGRLYR
jgi:CubicO group peptidase (beta-lactamase class C family)